MIATQRAGREVLGLLLHAGNAEDVCPGEPFHRFKETRGTCTLIDVDAHLTRRRHDPQVLRECVECAQLVGEFHPLMATRRGRVPKPCPRGLALNALQLFDSPASPRVQVLRRPQPRTMLVPINQGADELCRIVNASVKTTKVKRQQPNSS